MNFRRIHMCHCMQLLTTVMVLCMVRVCWEELDHHVVSHLKSYTYRYDFLNSSFFITSDNHHRKDGSNGVDGGLVNYPYLINHQGKCGGDGGDRNSHDDVLLLLFVKSSPENFEHRQAIRETWGNESFVWSELGASMRIVFALDVHKGGDPGCRGHWSRRTRPTEIWSSRTFWTPSTTFTGAMSTALRHAS